MQLPLISVGKLLFRYSSLYDPDSIFPVAAGSVIMFCVCWDITVSFQDVRDSLKCLPPFESTVLNNTRPCNSLSWLIENVIVLVELSYTPRTSNWRIRLLFYNLITLLSLVMSMNDDHARIGILIVLPLFDGWGESAFPILICLIPELAPTAYMFVYLFWSTISIPAKWPSNVNRTVFSSLSTWAE